MKPRWSASALGVSNLSRLLQQSKARVGSSAQTLVEHQSTNQSRSALLVRARSAAIKWSDALQCEGIVNLAEHQSSHLIQKFAPARPATQPSTLCQGQGRSHSDATFADQQPKLGFCATALGAEICLALRVETQRCANQNAVHCGQRLDQATSDHQSVKRQRLVPIARQSSEHQTQQELTAT